MDRRNFMKGAGVTVAAGTGLALFANTGAAAELSLDATKAVVQTADGEVESVYTNPSDIQLNWEGFDEAVNYVNTVINVKIAGVTSWKTITPDGGYTTGVADSGMSGSWSFNNDVKLTLYEGSNADHFDASKDGTSNTEEVVISVDATLLDSEKNPCDPQDTATFSSSATMPVVSQNKEASVSGSGTFEGGASG